MTGDRNSGSSAAARQAATRFKPGNPGRPKGTRHRATLAAEALLDGEAQALTRKAIELAKAGDLVALNLCLSRIVPPRRERPVRFDMPAITGAADHPGALSAMLSAVAAGELTASEAQALASLLAEHRRAVEVADHEVRLKALEDQVAAK